jgi:hypothetical protein
MEVPEDLAYKCYSWRQARHIACMGEMRNAYKILVRRPEGRDHLEDLGIDGRISLEWILGK